MRCGYRAGVVDDVNNGDLRGDLFFFFLLLSDRFLPGTTPSDRFRNIHGLVLPSQRI